MLRKIFPVFAFLFLCNPNSFAQEQQSNSFSSPTSNVELTLVEHNAFTFVPPPTILPVSERAATINVVYGAGFPANAQAAFQFAVDIWETLLNSNQIINITVTWTPVAGNNLAAANTTGWYQNFAGAPVNNTWYPQALAESICNCQLGANPDSRDQTLTVEIKPRQPRSNPDS